MSQDETMRLVAEVVDKYSGPLKDLNKALGTINAVGRRAHSEAAANTREHAKAYKELQEQVKKVKDTALDVLSPALTAVGLTSVSVAGAIGAVVAAVKNLGDAGQVLSFVNRQSGVTVGMIRALGDAGERFGVSQEQMNAGLAKFGAFMDQNTRRAPDALNAWNQMPGAWDRIGKSLIGLNRDAQVNKVLDFIPSVKYVDQRRKLLSIMGLPEDWANLTKEEMAKVRAAGERFNREHPFAAENAQKSKEAWDDLSSTFKGIKDDLGAAFGPDVVSGVKSIQSFLDDRENVRAMKDAMDDFAKGMKHNIEDLMQMAKDFKALWDWSPAEWMKQTPAELAAKVGKKLQEPGAAPANPGSVFPGGTSRSAAETKQILKDAVTDGFLDALRQQNSAGGYTPMAFHPGGGGGGYFGSKDYPAIAGGAGGGAPRIGGGRSNSSDVGAGSGTGGGTVPKRMGSGINDVDVSVAGGGNGNGVASPFDRARFAAELASNPALKEKVFQLSAGEDRPSSGSSKLANQAVMETMMNRAVVRGTSLSAQAKWYGREQGGYYAGKPSNLSAHEREVSESNLKAVLGGSNITDYATDNSSGGLAAREKATGKFQFHKDFHGESFFSPGWAEKGLQKRYGQLRQQALTEEAQKAATMHGASLRDHIRHGRKNATDGKLLENGRRSEGGGGMLGGRAALDVNFNNMPGGTRTAMRHNDLFKEVKLNRGRPMAPASQDA
jgi:hypothetical protein